MHLKVFLNVLAASVDQREQHSTGLISSTDFGIIRRGGLYVKHNWLDAEQVAILRRDIAGLRTAQKLKPSGLSNRGPGDSNNFGPADRLACTITPQLVPGKDARARVEEMLEDLRLQLRHELGIATLLLDEHYYSSSPSGSSLARHMDERHEETKGDKAWETETRRSISWLLYLNDAEWQSGGELRAYCRRSSCKCGAHEGNLQVGWLPARKDENATNDLFDPVFLDSWIKTRMEQKTLDDEEQTLQWRPLAALYRVSGPNKREYLTDPFGPDSPSWPSNKDLEPHDFASALASQLTSSLGLFTSVESIQNIRPIDVRPTGGTLVLFDSVAIPHEVLLTTTSGRERFAMAGWFHEPTQPYPEWYGT